MRPSQRITINRAKLAIDDAIRIYAPEWCDPKEVVKMRRRCWRSGGTLHYLASIRQELDQFWTQHKQRCEQ